MNFLYTERIVAFLDILGMRSLVSRIEADELLLQNLHGALAHIKNQERYANMDSTALSQMEISVFSDCIAISVDPTQASYVIMVCANLQNELLLQGIAVRGGVTLGKTFHGNGVLFGAGIVRAHDIESKEADTPRILVDNSVVDLISEGVFLKFLDRDEDLRAFIDPMIASHYIPGAEDLAAEGYDPRHVFLSEVRKHIVDYISDSPNSRCKDKWLWLARRFNLAKKRFPCYPNIEDITTEIEQAGASIAG
jgi:hypothetical protein